MGGSRKKSISQKVVGVATTGMPQPVKKFLGGRLIAAAILVAVPLLLASGVVSVNWEGGRPKLSFNRQRAAELKEEAVDEVQHLRKEHGSRGPDFGDAFGNRGNDTSVWPTSAQTQPTVADRFQDLRKDFGGGHTSLNPLNSGANQEPPETASGFNPLSRLKKTTDGSYR